MTYEEALQYLDSFINYEKADSYNYRSLLKLERMKRLAALLGDPQRAAPAVHVAGTKGKGSTAAYIYSILKAANFKVGLYTSPHLMSFHERIRVNDCFISEEEIARILNKIKNVIEPLMKDDRPSFFEVCTILAYLYFKEKNIDFAVYEVGLGGRLDATNIIEPLVSAITPLSYEHTDKLGNTLREIASEKGGIIKNNSICVVAPQEKEALKALEDICKEKKAKMIVVGRDILFEELEANSERELFNVFGLFNESPFLETRLLGSHQVINSTTAIGVIEALSFHNIMIPFEAV